MVAKRRLSVAAAAPNTKKQCHSVSKAVLSSEVLSESCRGMLSGMATFALNTCQDDRHPFQKDIVGMVNATLSGIEDTMIKRNAETEAMVGNAETLKAERAAARTDAESALKAKTDVAAQKKGAAQEAEAASKAAKAALAGAVSQQASADAELKQLVDKKEALETFRTGTFLPLKEGTLENAESKVAIKRISAIGSKFDVEKAMVVAGVDALKQPLADRSTFLTTAVAQMEQKVDALSAGFGQQIAKAETAKNERGAAVAATESVKADAEAVVASHVGAYKEAQSEHHAALSTLKAAEQSCKHFFPDMKKMMDRFDNSKTSLEEFQSTVMIAFKELQTLTAPPPPPVEPGAAADDTAMATAEADEA